MSREIKFRCWLATGRMAGPYSMKQLIEQTAFDDGITYLQFTGLLDKNGNEIYEGDILKFKHNGKGYIMGFEDGKFDLINFDSYGHDQQIAFEDEDEWEIIGNIYENAELLSTQKQ